MVHISSDLMGFLATECPNSRVKAGLQEPVAGVGGCGYKASRQFVFALCSGIKVGYALGNAVVDSLVIAGFKMQHAILLLTAPVAPI